MANPQKSVCFVTFHLPKNVVWRSFSKMYFRRRLLQPEAPGFRGDPRSNLEVFCHEATFQECQKSRKLRFHASVRPDPAAPGPRKLRVVFPLISVLSKRPQFNMGQNVVFGDCSRFTGAVLNRKVSHHPMMTSIQSAPMFVASSPTSFFSTTSTSALVCALSVSFGEVFQSECMAYP